MGIGNNHAVMLALCVPNAVIDLAAFHYGLSVSARPEFLGVIDDPLFENLGVIGKFRGSELF